MCANDKQVGLHRSGCASSPLILLTDEFSNVSTSRIDRPAIFPTRYRTQNFCGAAFALIVSWLSARRVRISRQTHLLAAST